MAFYYMDLFNGCVIAELTDASQALTIINNVGARYGVLETDAPLAPKPLTVPTGPAGSGAAGAIETTPDYTSLDLKGIAYTPLVVADALADYDVAPGAIHSKANRYDVVADGSGFARGISRIVNTPPPKDFLKLSTDATDDNPPDGYPDIPADGVSTCTIMIQKAHGMTGADLTDPTDNETIQLTTGAGRLSAVQVALVNGYAEVTLTSSTDTVVTNITAADDDGSLEPGTLAVQFA